MGVPYKCVTEIGKIIVQSSVMLDKLKGKRSKEILFQISQNAFIIEVLLCSTVCFTKLDGHFASVVMLFPFLV